MSQGNFKLITVTLLLVAGLTACDKPGTAEKAGKQIDQTTSNAGKKIDQTTSNAGKKIGETVGKAEKTASEQGAKAALAFDDSEITTKVKTAIFAEPGLKTLQISVDTVKGVVTLTGTVDSQVNSDKARSVTGAVAGVKEVINKLVVTPSK
jgi:hyperosmotically inducible periplasmic protein